MPLFINFLAFIKSLKCFIVVREKNGYVLKNKNFASEVFDEERFCEQSDSEKMVDEREF